MSDSSVKELAVLFADICGSTAIYHRLGDVEAHGLIARILEQLEEETYFHGGRVVKNLGDEILCTFPSVIAGVGAAVAMQQRALTIRSPGGEPIALRIGMHVGGAIEDKGDVFGDVVNVAARISGLADRGQVLITRPCTEGLSGLATRRIRPIEGLQVSAKSADLAVYEVVWRRASVTTTWLPPAPARPAGTSTLTLLHRGQTVTLRPDMQPFVIGRDPDCDLVAGGNYASRRHARIEWSRDKFVLFDQSTNGTYLKVDGMSDFFLKRENAPLAASGTLGLGEPPQIGDVEHVRFDCA